MQYGNVAFCTDLQEIHDKVIDDVRQIFKNDNNFVLVGYGFGALLTLKVAKTLELEGKTGKILIVDGSPNFSKALMQSCLPAPLTDEALETFILSTAIPLIASQDSEVTLAKVLSESDWSKRVNKFAEIGTEKKIYNFEFYVLFLYGLLNRIKLQIEMDFESHQVLDSAGTLIRPREILLQGIDDNYGLNSFIKNKVDVKHLNESHATISEDEMLREILNDSLKNFGKGM
jgi:hypothetical protein